MRIKNQSSQAISLRLNGGTIGRGDLDSLSVCIVDLDNINAIFAFNCLRLNNAVDKFNCNGCSSPTINIERQEISSISFFIEVGVVIYIQKLTRDRSIGNRDVCLQVFTGLAEKINCLIRNRLYGEAQ
jgi:hypothetical protein